LVGGLAIVALPHGEDKLAKIMRENGKVFKAISKKRGGVIISCLVCDPKKKYEYPPRGDAAYTLTRDHLPGKRHKKNLERALEADRLAQESDKLAQESDLGQTQEPEQKNEEDKAALHGY
jgi:hypothetical protein